MDSRDEEVEAGVSSCMGRRGVGRREGNGKEGKHNHTASNSGA